MFDFKSGGAMSVVVLLAVAAASCGPASTKGKWVMANQSIGSAADSSPEIISGMELELLNNGRFKMTGFPPLEGTYTDTNGTLTLKPTEKRAPTYKLVWEKDRYRQEEPKLNAPTFWVRPPEPVSAKK